MTEFVKRSEIIRDRSYFEKRFYLNESNSKWINIGIRPLPEKSTTFKEMDSFSVSILVCDRYQSYPLNGLGGLKELLTKLYNTGYFSAYEKPAYIAAEIENNIIIEQTDYGSVPVFKIIRNDIKYNSGYLSIKAAEDLFKMEHSLIKYIEMLKPVDTSTLFFKYIEKAIHSADRLDFNAEIEEADPFEKIFLIETQVNFADLFEHIYNRELSLGEYSGV